MSIVFLYRFSSRAAIVDFSGLAHCLFLHQSELACVEPLKLRRSRGRCRRYAS
jgi:hypothetical protein